MVTVKAPVLESNDTPVIPETDTVLALSIRPFASTVKTGMAVVEPYVPAVTPELANVNGKVTSPEPLNAWLGAVASPEIAKFLLLVKVSTEPVTAPEIPPVAFSVPLTVMSESNVPAPWTTSPFFTTKFLFATVHSPLQLSLLLF